MKRKGEKMKNDVIKFIPMGGQAEMGKSMYCFEINDKIFNAFGYAIKEKSTGGLENGESFVGIIRP